MSTPWKGKVVVVPGIGPDDWLLLDPEQAKQYTCYVTIGRPSQLSETEHVVPTTSWFERAREEE